MFDVLHWWLVSTVIGVAALPYSFRFLRLLPDGGLAFARPLGLLLTGYALWLGAYSGVLPNTGGSAAAIVALLAAGGVWIAGRDRAALLAHIRAHRRYLIAAEALFLIVFAAFALFRAYSSEVEATEKPFESAFFNSVLRSTEFPPVDPWFSGEAISYYYVGHVPLGMLNMLAGTPPEVGFNVAVAITAGLAAITLYGLVYNLLALRGGFLPRTLLLAALLGPFFFLIVSNLAGVFEVWAVNGLDAGWVYRLIDIDGLRGPKESTAWYPTEYWWWWRATRLAVGGWNIMEFPFFTFMLGDLHAHLIVLPYLVTTLAAALSLLRADEPLDLWYLRRHPWRVLGLALFAGALYVINAWDFPTALAFIGLLTLAHAYTRAERTDIMPLVRSLGFLVPLAVLAVLLYLPFYLGFQAAPTAIEATRVVEPARPTFLPAKSEASPPVQFAIFWTPLLFPVLTYLLWRAVALRVWRLNDVSSAMAVFATLLPLFAWALIVARHDGVGAIQDELAGRGSMLWPWLFLILFVTLAGFVLIAEVLHEREQRRGGLEIFAAAAILGAGFLIWVPELLYVREITIPGRHTTVFKFYFTAWLLLSSAGAAGLCAMLSAWTARTTAAHEDVAATPAPAPAAVPAAATAPAPVAPAAAGRFVSLGSFGADLATGALILGGIAFVLALLTVLPTALRWVVVWLGAAVILVGGVYWLGRGLERRRGAAVAAAGGLWAALGLIILGGSLVYPAAASVARSNGFEDDPTLNGLTRMRLFNPDEWAGIMWLRQNLDGQPVVLEATGGDFTYANRISAHTGLPTILGWIAHEHLWRNELAPAQARAADIQTLYTSVDPAQVRQLLDQYEVRYAYVGPFEREQYGPEAGRLFEQIGRPVFSTTNVKIYAVDVPGAPLVPAQTTRP